MTTDQPLVIGPGHVTFSADGDAVHKGTLLGRLVPPAEETVGQI